MAGGNSMSTNYERVDEPLPPYESTWGTDPVRDEEKGGKGRGVWLRRIETVRTETERFAKKTPPYLQGTVWPWMKKIRFSKRQVYALLLVLFSGIIPFALVGYFTGDSEGHAFSQLFDEKTISCGNNVGGTPQNSTVGGVEALFVLDVTMGKFKFSQVKVIDVVWDVVVGRGAQLLAWYASYVVFTDALLRVIERHPASFETFTHLCLEGACLASIWTLFKDLFRTKSKRTWFLFFYMVLSFSYVMSLPTILGAMTGYVSTAVAWVDVANSDQIIPASNFQYGYILYSTGNTTFNSTCLVSDYYDHGAYVDSGLSAYVQLERDKEEYCDCQLPNGTVVPFRNWTYRYAYDSNYTYADCVVDFTGNNGQYIDRYTGESGNCNATVDLRINGHNYTALNVNYTNGYCNDGKAYEYSDLLYHTRCLPDTANPSYQWGFSSMLSGVFLIVQFTWVLTMYMVWQDAQFNSQLVKSGYRMTMLRAAFAVSMAARWRTGMSNGELIRRETSEMKKDLFGQKGSKKKEKRERAEVDVDVFREVKGLDGAEERGGMRKRRRGSSSSSITEREV